MASAYLVMTFREDRLVGIGVFSEPSPTAIAPHHRLMIAKATGETYIEAARHLERMAAERMPPYFQKFIQRHYR
jgi:hypothetical protein